jgi:hypothetical protein
MGDSKAKTNIREGSITENLQDSLLSVLPSSLGSARFRFFHLLLSVSID